MPRRESSTWLWLWSIWIVAPRQPTRQLAVLGVLSTEAATRMRHAARTTWFAELTNGSGILSKFVLRGVNASNEVVAEHRTHGDMVFVGASASLPRVSGPLRSLVVPSRGRG